MNLESIEEGTVSVRVANILREAIQRGEFEPGERLVERKLVATLGVSHIPVREALAKLTEEGLVERMPRRGARVSALTSQDLAEISSLRTLLEQFVCERAQERWSPAAEDSLRGIVAEMIEASREGDLEGMFGLDRTFHESLWELADHGILLTVASQLRGRINGFLRAANAALGNDELVAHAEEHALLVDALASGDVERAKQAMARHIELAALRIEATSVIER